MLFSVERSGSLESNLRCVPRLASLAALFSALPRYTYLPRGTSDFLSLFIASAELQPMTADRSLLTRWLSMPSRRERFAISLILTSANNDCISHHNICIGKKAQSTAMARLVKICSTGRACSEQISQLFSQFMAFEHATFVLVCSQVLRMGKTTRGKSTYKPVSENTG